MAAMDSRLVGFTPEETIIGLPSPPSTVDTNSPQHRRSPSQDANEAQRKRQQRHSKKLSINFPIVLPSRPNDTPSTNYTASPIALSTHAIPHNTFFSPPSSYNSNSFVPSSVIVPAPLTPPSEEDPLHAASKSGSKIKGHARQESTSTEFLTLLASQERRVLELKEELSRAETELTSLKRQWALYEAGKKKNNLKSNAVKMEPVSTSRARAASVVEVNTGLGLSGVDEPIDDDKLEAERERRREIARERMMGRWTAGEIGQPMNGNTKKTGQRVFSNSKHTRTLSLLATTTGTRGERTDSLESVTNNKQSLDSPRQSSVDTPLSSDIPSIPSLSRANSGLDGLNLGKTYKDLATAAGRTNLPPGLSPEQFVKHGKQVVDGVRDGLWNFFEDIRQATVGDEAINGVGNGTRRQPSVKQHGGAGNSKSKRTTADESEQTTTTKRGSQKENEPSFWKEFGVDTPKSDKSKRNNPDKVKEKRLSRPSLPGRWPSTKTGEDFSRSNPKHNHDHGHDKTALNLTSAPPKTKTTRKEGGEHHESKSSTDSRNPPSLVADLLDEEDDAWDNWDSNSATDPGSPQSVRKKAARRMEGPRNRANGEAREVQWHDLLS